MLALFSFHKYGVHFVYARGRVRNNRPMYISIFLGRYVTSVLSLLVGVVESSWNVMADGDAREGKWRGNWWMEWVASTLHTTSEHGVSSITTADAHTSAASSRLNWHSCWFKWTLPFRRKKESGFCACAITFQTQCTVDTLRRWRRFVHCSQGHRQELALALHVEVRRQYNKSCYGGKEWMHAFRSMAFVFISGKYAV